MLFVLTDEKDKTWFAPLEAAFAKIYYLHDFQEEVADLYDPNALGMVEQVVASAKPCRLFTGTFFSTFSGYVARLRAYYGHAADTFFYAAPEAKHRVLHDTSDTIHAPFYNREWALAWNGLDQPWPKDRPPVWPLPAVNATDIKAARRTQGTVARIKAADALPRRSSGRRRIRYCAASDNDKTGWAGLAATAWRQDTTSAACGGIIIRFSALQEDDADERSSERHGPSRHATRKSRGCRAVVVGAAALCGRGGEDERRDAEEEEAQDLGEDVVARTSTSSTTRQAVDDQKDDEEVAAGSGGGPAAASSGRGGARDRRRRRQSGRSSTTWATSGETPWACAARRRRAPPLVSGPFLRRMGARCLRRRRCGGDGGTRTLAPLTRPRPAGGDALGCLDVVVGRRGGLSSTPVALSAARASTGVSSTIASSAAAR